MPLNHLVLIEITKNTRYPAEIRQFALPGVLDIKISSDSITNHKILSKTVTKEYYQSALLEPVADQAFYLVQALYLRHTVTVYFVSALKKVRYIICEMLKRKCRN